MMYSDDACEVYRRSTIATKQPKKTKTKSPADPARALAIAIARLASDMHCSAVAVLDVRHLSPVTDYFVLATGTSTTQMRAVAYSAAEVAADHDYKALAMSGDDGDTWIVVDFVHVVMHVFNEESRQFYDLDALWGDAPKTPWEPKAAKRTPSAPSATKPKRPQAPRAKKTAARPAGSKSRKRIDHSPENASE